MNKIKELIIELESLNDFDNKCIVLLRKEQLFNDSRISIEFLNVIFEDEFYPLS